MELMVTTMMAMLVVAVMVTIERTMMTMITLTLR